MFAFVKTNLIFAERAEDVAKHLACYPAVFIVADRKVRKFVTESVAESCAQKGVALRGVLNIRVNERRKTLKTVEMIQRWLIGAGADRDALVLAIGGGVTTDLVGFAAASYKRGIRYANLPTTLLAQADAAIGGKTGCNIGDYKNMCGAFLMPEFTFICPSVLRTLPWNEIVAGYAEVVKAFIIGDPAAYRKALEGPDPDTIGELAARAAQIKAEIVEKDFTEQGERRLLNLGHTYAHAIETVSHHRIKHGEAVAIGIIMAAERAERCGIAAEGFAGQLARDFEKMGLPTCCRWSEDELLPIMRSDKKVTDGEIVFVLPVEIGKVVIA